jgi:hypothetical protein
MQLIPHLAAQLCNLGGSALNPDVCQSAKTASVAEIAWIGTDGRPDALPITPLVLNDTPVVAYPFAYQTLAYRIAASPVIALVTSEPRMAANGWQPMAAIGRARLIEDREGQIMKDELLTQELRKFPPSRALADSMLLRQENWWYVPRVIVAIDVESVRPVVARSGPDQQVLAVHGPDGLAVDTVQVADGGPDELRLSSLAERAAPAGHAVLLGHDFSAPDLERWTPWVTRGALSADGNLTVTEWPERTTLEPTPKLRQRYRRHRQLQKACRAALKAG